MNDGPAAPEYDDDHELDRYVWEGYWHLLTDLERAVGRAVRAEQKADAADGPVASHLRRSWGIQSNPRVREALRDGWAPYRTRARERILREHPAEVVVNRCPACARVVRTPRARQCLWCGHDWHVRSAD